MALSIGQTYNGRYRIQGLLGQGGFGAVYLADDSNLERLVAIKESLDASPRAEENIKREAKLLSKLRHPNLPRVYDLFSIPGQGQYLVMEYIAGQDLEEMQGARGDQPFPQAQVLNWTYQVCAALAYLHRQNPPIIHRDIKPANIRITPEGNAILVDFGIAKRYDPHSRSSIRAGSLGFSPPEQYTLKGTDVRSDIYSLGATLYKLLTGITPTDPQDVSWGNVPPPRAAHVVNPQVSEKVSSVLAQAMQLNRSQRFASVAEFQAELLEAASAGVSEPPEIEQLDAVESDPVVEVVQPVSPVSIDTDHERTLIHTDEETRLSPEMGLDHSWHPGITRDDSPLVNQDEQQKSTVPPPGELSLELAPGVEIHFVYVPAGAFWMGSDPTKDKAALLSEQPQHRVYVSAYYIGRYPVTNEQYAVFLQSSGYIPASSPFRIPERKEKHPVVNVSWHDARAFCAWLEQRVKVAVRLPSEAEWEKAARGEDGRIYPWGDGWEKQRCNTRELQLFSTTVVGQFSPAGDSLYGCADMAGNVMEWCADWYAEDTYQQRAGQQARDPQGPGSGKARVVRGGAWFDTHPLARCAFRYHEAPEYFSLDLGFRLAFSLM